MSSMGMLQYLLHMKLNPTNYLMWKNQLELLINCFELIAFIDPFITPPSTTIFDIGGKSKIQKPDFAMWWKKDQLLKRWLLFSLSIEAMPSTIGFASSAKIWECL